MKTLSDLLTEHIDVTNDTSTANTARATRRMNQAQKMICGKKEYFWLKKDYTFLTQASVAAYQLPIRFRRVSSVRIRIGTLDYQINEIADPIIFDSLKGSNGSTYTSDYPRFYHVREDQILFDCNLSTAGNTVYIEGIARPKDMSLLDYATGTVSVTSGSKTVTGSGTSWAASNAKAGAWIIIDLEAYQIAAVGGTTSITLIKSYEGVTASGLSYKIGDAPIIPEEFQDILWMSSAKDFIGIKKVDTKAYSIMKAEYLEIMNALESSTNSATTENVWSRRKIYDNNPNDYPRDIG